MSCLFLGDSIALGLALLNPQCHHVAVVGRSAQTIARHVPDSPRDVVVVSAGSNDSKSPILRQSIVRIRKQLTARVIVWVLPVDRRARSIVRSVAVTYGDSIISFVPGRDHIHPQSYRVLNQEISVFFDGD